MVASECKISKALGWISLGQSAANALSEVLAAARSNKEELDPSSTLEANTVDVAIVMLYCPGTNIPYAHNLP
jgi:hypothetical protein